jgi:tetratricopeptide (TPR) repeat protein
LATASDDLERLLHGIPKETKAEKKMRGFVETVRILIAAGASIEAKEKETGLTALQRAVYIGHIEIAEILLCAGAKCTQADIIIWADRRGHYDLAERLRAKLGGNALDDLDALWGIPFEQASRGQYKEAAEGYELYLEIIQATRTDLTPEQLAQKVRTAAFHLAHVDNKLGRFQEAIDLVDMGLGKSPTPYGRALGLAAKGEALCRLRRVADGRQAFEQAVEVHHVCGRLNAADSMTRLEIGACWR